MATTKKNVKVRDLKPTKDAKGGGTHVNRGSTHTSGTGTNSTKGTHKHSTHSN